VVVAFALPLNHHRLPHRSQGEGEERGERGFQEGGEEDLLTWCGHPDGWSRTALGLV